MINRFDDKHDFLSNFHPCNFKLNGYWFISAEHAYQLFKTEDMFQQRIILQTRTPVDARRMGRLVNLRGDWEDVKVGIMKKVVAAKFSDQYLKIKLKATGDEQLIEDNYWHDNFWGDCNCQKCFNTPGENHLGRILMEVRNVL